VKNTQKTLITKLIGYIFLASIAPVSYAQICQTDNLPQTTPAENFTTINNEITQDNVTKLEWQRCAYGQVATSASCEGTAQKLDWQAALQAAQNLGNGWRLPNVKELASIIDYQCFAPPANLSIFPNTPTSEESGLWTSTPAQRNIPSEETIPSIWFFDLAHGHLQRKPYDEVNYVRFVRN